MSNLDAGRAGTFAIGGHVTVNRLGFGAMRITGQGIWGEPAAAIALSAGNFAALDTAGRAQFATKTG